MNDLDQPIPDFQERDFPTPAALNRGFVYVIERPDGYVKIGRSMRPEARMRAIAMQAGFEPKNTWISEELENAAFVERASHEWLTCWRTIGEWFEIEFDFAVMIVSGNQRADKTLSVASENLTRSSSEILGHIQWMIDALIASLASDIRGDRNVSADTVNAAIRFLSPELNRLASAITESATKLRKIDGMPPRA